MKSTRPDLCGLSIQTLIATGSRDFSLRNWCAETQSYAMNSCALLENLPGENRLLKPNIYASNEKKWYTGGIGTTIHQWSERGVEKPG
jgi:hypothetical protein